MPKALFYRPRIILPKVEGFFSLPWWERAGVGVKLLSIASTYPPPPNPLPPGEGEIPGKKLVKVLAKHNTSVLNHILFYI